MSFEDFDVQAPSESVFGIAESTILSGNFKIRRRIRDNHIFADGRRNLNLYGFLTFLVFGLIFVAIEQYIGPFFLIVLLLIILIMASMLYFSSPRNNIYLDIVKKENGVCKVNITSSGKEAEELEKSINSAIISNGHSDE